ncbi:hypothetical protein HU200_026675 [Digitaria exilis]|uniref:Uncharacterized protein n=1 Tax=Digitaria exilis TaxID=1010633 RepID=A0A835EU12_9POAL|nr:hypothetical protein HU200_026675 [Digitaria exilis]CAB3464648.1 unnamed protein product [Digitaria exilis]
MGVESRVSKDGPPPLMYEHDNGTGQGLHPSAHQLRITHRRTHRRIAHRLSVPALPGARAAPGVPPLGARSPSVRALVLDMFCVDARLGVPAPIETNASFGDIGDKPLCLPGVPPFRAPLNRNDEVAPAESRGILIHTLEWLDGGRAQGRRVRLEPPPRRRRCARVRLQGLRWWTTDKVVSFEGWIERGHPLQRAACSTRTAADGCRVFGECDRRSSVNVARADGEITSKCRKRCQ